MNNDKRNLLNTILAIFACLLWSTAFVGVKIALEYMSPLVLAGIRFILAAILIVPFCGGIRSIVSTLTNHTRTVLLVSLLQTFLLYGSFFMAMQYVGGAIAAIIIGSSPLTAALTAHIMMKDDKMNPRNSTAILFGIAGIIIISLSRKPWEPVGLVEFVGIMVLLCGSAVSAVGNVLVAKKKNDINAIALNCLQMFIGGVALLLVGLVTEGIPSMSLPSRFYLALLWLAALSATAFSIWFHLLGQVKVSRLNIWKFLIPVFGAISSWIILDAESPTWGAVAGLLLVTVGVVTASTQKEKGRSSQAS